MYSAIRIEGGDGVGFFRATENFPSVFCVEELRQVSTRHNKFNTPQEDGLIIMDYHFCAYKTVKQMTDWVRTHELKDIIALGYKVFSLKLEHCQHGRDQIIFKKSDIIEKTDITDLFL